MTKPAAGTEQKLLLATLTRQRDHVLGILDGLPEDALRRAVLPTGWTCLGLVQHLAVDVERFWFRRVAAGEPIELDPDPAGGWRVDPGQPAQPVLDGYRHEITLADAIITSTPLDTAPAWWPGFFGTWQLRDLREILLHVITETACHAGHLDAARELIDGRTWLILTK
jgi:Protein of unknown function (DUF664)